MAKLLENLTAKARRTRSEIVRAARGIVGLKGIAGVNVMEVCAAADVGRTSFYNYFDDIDGLVEAVAADVAQAIRVQFEGLHSDEPRGSNRLEKCLYMLFETAVQDPETVLLLTSLAVNGSPVRDVLQLEILEELRGANHTDEEQLLSKAHFLTSCILALSRDFASGQATRKDIPSFVMMLMDSADSEHTRF